VRRRQHLVYGRIRPCLGLVLGHRDGPAVGQGGRRVAQIEDVQPGRELPPVSDDRPVELERRLDPGALEVAAVDDMTPDGPVTGNFFIDEGVLAAAGITELEGYAVRPGGRLLPDLFLS
jgi:hypothetical protein